MMDEAAAREIERLGKEISQLRGILVRQIEFQNSLLDQLRESERQRKQLSEYIETLAKGGIEAATGAGK